MEAMQWWDTEGMNLGNAFPLDARYIALCRCPDTHLVYRPSRIIGDLDTLWLACQGVEQLGEGCALKNQRLCWSAFSCSFVLTLTANRQKNTSDLLKKKSTFLFFTETCN